MVGYASNYTQAVLDTAVELTADDFRSLIKDYRNGNEDALDMVFRGLYKLIFDIIRKNYRLLAVWDIHFDDVFNTFIGLTKEKIIDKYDVDGKTSLSTFTHRWLNLAIIQLPRFINLDNISIKREGSKYVKEAIMNIEDYRGTEDNEEYDITHLIDDTDDLIEGERSDLKDAISMLSDDERDYIKSVFGYTVDGTVVRRKTKEDKYLERKKMSIERRDEILEKVRTYLKEMY